MNNKKRSSNKIQKLNTKAKREADKEHKARTNRDAAEAITSIVGITEEASRLIVEAIAKGKVPSVKIEY